MIDGKLYEMMSLISKFLRGQPHDAVLQNLFNFEGLGGWHTAAHREVESVTFVFDSARVPNIRFAPSSEI